MVYKMLRSTLRLLAEDGPAVIGVIGVIGDLGGTRILEEAPSPAASRRGLRRCGDSVSIFGGVIY